MVTPAACPGTGPLLSASGDEEGQRLLGASVQDWEMATAEMLPVGPEEPWPSGTRVTGIALWARAAASRRPEPAGSSPPPLVRLPAFGQHPPLASQGLTGSALAIGWQEGDKGGQGAVVSWLRGARSRRFPTPASRGAVSSPAWQRAGSRRGRRCWNNETEHARPGGSLADLSNPGEGAPAWKSPSAAVLILIWGLGGEFGKKGSKVWFPAFCPTPTWYTLFRPALWVALFFDFYLLEILGS